MTTVKHNANLRRVETATSDGGLHGGYGGVAGVAGDGDLIAISRANADMNGEFNQMTTEA
jgi:hypothetical protein